MYSSFVQGHLGSTTAARGWADGYPGDLGGAGTETWATIKGWCQFRVDVHVIATWGCDVRGRQRCDALGCTTHDATDQPLGACLFRSP